MTLRLAVMPIALAVACASVPQEAWPAPTATGAAAASPADPTGPITIDEAAGIAVARNPTLVALRAALGVSAAGVTAAGLWPDPGVSTGLVVPVSGSESIGLDAGIHWQLSSLWTTGPVIAAAAADANAARFQVRWEEQAARHGNR